MEKDDTKPSRMTTASLPCTWTVKYEVMRQDWTGGEAKVLTGPDGTGGYTDFEDIREIIAIRRGLKAEDILVYSCINDLEG